MRVTGEKDWVYLSLKNITLVNDDWIFQFAKIMFILNDTFLISPILLFDQNASLTQVYF